MAVGGGGVTVTTGFVGAAVGGGCVGLAGVVAVAPAVVAVAAEGEGEEAARVAVAWTEAAGAVGAVAAAVGESGTGVGVGSSPEPPQVAASARHAQHSTPATGKISDFGTDISANPARQDPARARYIRGGRSVDGGSCLQARKNPRARPARATGRYRAYSALNRRVTSSSGGGPSPQNDTWKYGGPLPSTVQ